MIDSEHGLRPRAVAVALACALGLAGCGGGGGNVRPSSPPATPPPATGTGTGTGDFIGGDVNVGPGNTQVFSNDISGSIDLIKQGAGSLVLTGTDSYSGGTTISAGTLQLGNGGTTGSIVGDVTDYGSLVFDRSDSVTFDGIVSGSGSLEQAGKGSLILTGDNIYSGGTTISAGTLQLGNGGTTGSIVGDVTDNGSLVFDHSDDVTFSGIVSGSGSLEQAGKGILILTGDNTYTGGTTISAGTLQLGSEGTTGSIAGDVRNEGSLVFNPSEDLSYNGVVSGNGTLVKSGKGDLTLTGASTYSGGTTVSGGTLEIASGSPGTGTITVSYAGYYDATLRLDSTASISNHVVLDDGTLDNSGSLTNNVDTIAVESDDSSATILNHDGGSIEAANSAVMLVATYGMVKNDSGSTIEGGNLGVGMADGGYVSNDGAGSVISATRGTAVQIAGNSAIVKNTGGGIIAGGSTAIYLSRGGEITNGSGSTIKSTGVAGNCQSTGGCSSIFVPAASNGELTLTNAGTIIGDVRMDPTALNFTTLWAGGSIQGNLDMGPNGSLTLQGDAGTVQLSSRAVTGTNTFASLSKYGDGTWIIDNNEFASVKGIGIVVGTLQVGNGDTNGSIGQNNISLYSTLVFDRSDNVTFSGNIVGGGGSLVQAGSGTLVLTGESLSPEHLTIKSGILQIGDGGQVGSPTADVLNNGSLVVDHSNDVILREVISGTGSLTQEGSGTLILNARNTYTGGTTVSDGILQTLEPLPGNVTVNAPASLDSISYIGSTGEFAVAGNLSNAGKVLVHGGDGVVGSNYTQASTGTLAVSLGSKLHVGATATLNGGTLEVTGADSGYVSNTHTDVLTAGSGVTGTFGQLVKDAGVVFTASTIHYDANSVWLDTTGLNVTTAAAGPGVSYTPVSMGSAQRVQGAFEQMDDKIAAGKPSGASNNFLQAAGQFQQAPTLQAAQASLQSLSGQLHAASAAMIFQGIDASDRALSDHFDNLLGKLNGMGARAGAGFGTWMQNLNVGGDMSRAGYDGVGFHLNGWLIGNDRQIGGSGVAGFAFGQSQGRQQLDQSFDHDNSRTTEGMFYAGLLNGNWYTQGRVGFGHFQQDVSRQILLGYSAQGVGTQYNGSYDVAYGESGLHFEPAYTQVTPFVNVEYSRIGRDGFAEQGAGGFGLRSDAQTLDRWQAGLGVRASRHWNLGNGRAVDFNMRAQWQRTVASRGDVFDASFVGLQQWQPLVGIGLSRYSGLFGAGLNATLSARTALNFSYDYQMGQRDTAQMLAARFSVAF